MIICVCQDPKSRLTSRTALRTDLNWEGQLGDTNQKELYKELPYRHDTQQEGDHNTGQKEMQTLYTQVDGEHRNNNRNLKARQQTKTWGYKQQSEYNRWNTGT